MIHNIWRPNMTFQMIREAVSKSKFRLKIMDDRYSCFVFVRNHMQCKSTAPELRPELGTDDCDPKTVALIYAT